MHKRGDGLKRLIRRLNMHIIIDLSVDAFVLKQRTYPIWQADLHYAFVSDDQCTADTKSLEIIPHLVGGSRTELDGGHLHRNDGFVGDIKAPHTIFSLLVVECFGSETNLFDLFGIMSKDDRRVP